jgi:hypothetical protein
MDVEDRKAEGRSKVAMNGESETSEGKATGAREIIFFFLRFLAASILLYLAYIVAGKYYTRLIAEIAKPLLAAAGYKMIMDKAILITEYVSLNPVVFLSLVIAVGRISIRAKLKAAAIGCLILTAANALTIFFAFMSYYVSLDPSRQAQGERLWAGSEFLNLTICFFLPLLLWVVLLPIRSAFSFFRTKQ